MVMRALVASLVLASGTVGSAQVAFLEPAPRSSAGHPRADIVCGTRIFRADPAIDPKIAKATPQDQGTFTLRTVQPPVCRDSFPARVSELRQRLPQFLGPKR
jgi:hypothetical protein